MSFISIRQGLVKVLILFLLFTRLCFGEKFINFEKEIYKPDLLIKDIKMSVGYSGIDYKVYISNKGLVSTGKFYITFSINGKVYEKKEVPGINSAEVVICQGRIRLPEPQSSFVVVCMLDPDNFITESDESNNIKTYPINYDLRYEPDLCVEKLKVIPETMSNFTKYIECNIMVKNIGVKTAESARVKVYLNGELRKTITLPSLKPGRTRVLKTILKNLPSTSFSVLASIEASFLEKDKGNNKKFVPVFKVKRLLPDLTVKILSGRYNFKNFKLELKVLVRNDSPISAGAFSIEIFNNEAFAREINIPGLKGMEELVKEISISSLPQNSEVKVVVDRKGKLKENNRLNNIDTHLILVENYSDAYSLAIVSFSSDKEVYYINESLNVEIKLKSLKKDLENIEVVVKENGHTVFKRKINKLLSGKVKTLNFAKKLKFAGEIEYKLIVNFLKSDKRRVKFKEDYFEVQVKNPPSPEIKIISMNIEKRKFLINKFYRLKVKIQNSGEIKASDLKLLFFINNKKVDTKIISIGRESVVDYLFPFSTTKFGRNVLTVQAYLKNKNGFAEKVYEKSKVIFVNANYPDLKIYRVTHKPQFPKLKDKITVNIEIINKGKNFAKDVVLIVREGRYRIFKHIFKKIDKGEKVNITFKLPRKRALMRSLLIIVDPENLIQELNEKNNSVKHIFSVL